MRWRNRGWPERVLRPKAAKLSKEELQRLRARAVKFVEESVIQSARSVESDSESVDVGRLQKWLEGLSDDELGKYKM